MEALDYYPDQVARSLKTGKTNVIGIVVPDITNVFYPTAIRGFEDAARRSGYSVLLCDSNDDAAEEHRHLATLLSRRVDGILLACSIESTAHQFLARRHFPVVFFDCIPAAATHNTVSTDNVQAGYLATKHLIDLGHTRIALLTGELSLSSHIERLEGFRQAMQQAHLTVIDSYLARCGVQMESGYAASRELLKLQNRPTAIIATNNKLALGLLKAINESGFNCPGQVSAVGIDDGVWSDYLTPPLTAVAQSTYEMGTRSFEILRLVMQGSPSERQVRLSCELRVRQSTACPLPDPAFSSRKSKRSD
jgi:LacI family transcriptional regulator